MNAPVTRFDLGCVSIDTRSRRCDYGPRMQEFLQAHRDALQLQTSPDELIDEYLRRAWPAGVPGTFIASNITFNGHPLWLLRPTADGPAAGLLSAGTLQPGLRVYRKQARLVVKGFEVCPRVPRRATEFTVVGTVHWDAPSVYMAAEDLDRLSTLPARRKALKSRLDGWHEYVTWLSHLLDADADSLTLPYAAAVADPEERCVRLLVEDLDRRRAKTLRSTDLKVVEALEGGRTHWHPLGRPSVCAATAEERARHTGEDSPLREAASWLCFSFPASDRPLPAIPASGTLSPHDQGSRSVLTNQHWAISRTHDESGFAPRLASWLFDAGEAAVPDPSTLEAEFERLEDTTLNPAQRSAVAKALAAPDLCLIQGPPGTGKTTVIAEICRQAVLRGQRVLVASQTNLAVDNALARLKDVPRIRRLRIGNADKVDPEYQEFLEEHVVQRWFQTIRNACGAASVRDRALLEEQRRRRNLIETLESALDELESAAEALATHRRGEGHLVARHAELSASREAAARAEDDAHRRQRDLAELRSWIAGEVESPSRPPATDEAVDAALLRPLADVLDGLPRDCEHRPSVPGPEQVLRSATQVRLAKPRTSRAQQAIDDAIAACNSGAAALEATGELAELQAERQHLVNATALEELMRLGEVNERIKALKDTGWGATFNELAAALQPLGLAAAPQLAAVRGAASANAALIPHLRGLSDLVVSFFSVAEAVDRVLSAALDRTDDWVARTTAAARAAAARATDEATALTSLEAQIDTLHAAMEATSLATSTANQRWREAWARLSVPDSPDHDDGPNSEALRAAELAVEAWEADAKTRLGRAGRYHAVRREWQQRLASITESDREHLQDLYRKHANVVGMTCNEAGSKRTWQSALFDPYDIVVIDEVSKATPPELLMPMLLGRRVVLVGDHRQLPPMFGPRKDSYAEAIEDGKVSARDFERHQKMVTAGLFEELFLAAPPDIKHTLDTQYRMHPRIMDAVNQFYAGALQAGPDRERLAEVRGHGLDVPDHKGGQLIGPDQPLVWIDSSRDASGARRLERQEGTSKSNPFEVALIVETMGRIGESLAARGYRADPLEVSADDSAVGRPVWEWLERALADMDAEDRGMLLAEGSVRLDGRRTDGRDIVQPGHQLSVDRRRDVGVISFYGAQVSALRAGIDRAKEASPEAFATLRHRVDSVDRFQGMERALVIVSLVRSTKSAAQLGGFVRSYQRINVALSRAQRLLVVVGAADCFKGASVDLGEGESARAYLEILELARLAGGYRNSAQLEAGASEPSPRRSNPGRSNPGRRGGAR